MLQGNFVFRMLVTGCKDQPEDDSAVQTHPCMMPVSADANQLWLLR